MKVKVDFGGGNIEEREIHGLTRSPAGVMQAIADNGSKPGSGVMKLPNERYWRPSEAVRTWAPDWAGVA